MARTLLKDEISKAMIEEPFSGPDKLARKQLKGIRASMDQIRARHPGRFDRTERATAASPPAVEIAKVKPNRLSRTTSRTPISTLGGRDLGRSAGVLRTVVAEPQSSFVAQPPLVSSHPAGEFSRLGRSGVTPGPVDAGVAAVPSPSADVAGFPRAPAINEVIRSQRDIDLGPLTSSAETLPGGGVRNIFDIGGNTLSIDPGTDIDLSPGRDGVFRTGNLDARFPEGTDQATIDRFLAPVGRGATFAERGIRRPGAPVLLPQRAPQREIVEAPKTFGDMLVSGVVARRQAKLDDQALKSRETDLGFRTATADTANRRRTADLVADVTRERTDVVAEGNRLSFGQQGLRDRLAVSKARNVNERLATKDIREAKERSLKGHQDQLKLMTDQLKDDFSLGDAARKTLEQDIRAKRLVVKKSLGGEVSTQKLTTAQQAIALKYQKANPKEDKNAILRRVLAGEIK